MTTLVGASVKPKVSRYVANIHERLDQFTGAEHGDREPIPFYIMKSNGGVLSADEVVHQPITTVLSGPAAGALGAGLIAREAGFAKVLTCDGGGTSYMYRFNFATGTVTGVQVTGVVGALTPLTTIPTSARTAVTVDPRSVITGWAGGGAGQPQGSAAQCTVYSASIQGRPSVIAQACPGFTPLRVWRQPMR